MDSSGGGDRVYAVPSARLRQEERSSFRLLPLVFPLCAAAQVQNGQITGSVADPSGAVVSGAKIFVRNLGNLQRSATLGEAADESRTPFERQLHLRPRYRYTFRLAQRRCDRQRLRGGRCVYY